MSRKVTELPAVSIPPVKLVGDDLNAAALAREYLTTRGVPEDFARLNEIEPLDPRETHRRAGPHNAYSRAALAIPYWDVDGNRLDYDVAKFLGDAIDFTPSKDQKRPPKFLCPAGQPTPAYLPRGRPWRQVANDVSETIYIAEGQTRALAGCARGLNVIGITGCENWHLAGDESILVPGLSDIQWRGRTVHLVPDSDLETNGNVRRAAEKWRAQMTKRGAYPTIIRLPFGPSGEKLGMDDLLATQGLDAFLRLVETQSDPLPDALDDGASLLDGEIPPVEWVVEKYLPRGEVVEAHGPHGVGKSTIMLGAALAVATGQPWGGQPVNSGKAAFVTLEDTKPTLARRVRAWVEGTTRVRKHGSERPNAHTKDLARGIRENFKCLTREKAGPLTITGTSYGQTTVNVAAVDRLVKLVAGCSLVILETGARLHPGPEINESLAVFATAVERIVTRTGACVVLVRHVSKDVARTGQTDSYGARGGGSFADAARSVLSIAREGDGDDAPIKLVHAKSTHSARGLDLMWRTEVYAGAVHLRSLSDEERAHVGAGRVLDRIRTAGEDGVTQAEIIKDVFPTKVRTERAKALPGMLKALEDEGAIVGSAQGGKGRPTTRYRTADAHNRFIERSASPEGSSASAAPATKVARRARA